MMFDLLIIYWHTLEEPYAEPIDDDFCEYFRAENP